jgi:uncharacterized membrane protein YtjA (UPF0391 family)
MPKNWLAATGWAILYWVLIFVVISIIMFGLPSLSSTNQNIISLIIEIGLVLFCAGMYFKKYPGTFVNGIILGVWFLIVGTVLDLLITVPLFVKSYSAFYGTWNLWVGFVITILFSGLATGIFRKK